MKFLVLVDEPSEIRIIVALRSFKYETNSGASVITNK
jgi:hypothetical protein